jgi:lipopolysaccharide export system protein LptA
MAALPSSAIPEPREKEEKAGLKEEKPQKKEMEKAKEKEVSKKEIPAGLKEFKPGEPGEPIDITSDRVETFSKENLIVFKGNVMARQKDIVIYSDSLEATIFEDGKGIEKVIAGGNVKIQQGLRVAHCQKAVFYNRDQKVVLTGDPKVWEGDNLVSGEEIIFDITRNRVEVKGGPKERGKVRVIPGEGLEKLK